MILNGKLLEIENNCFSLNIFLRSRKENQSRIISYQLESFFFLPDHELIKYHDFLKIIYIIF